MLLVVNYHYIRNTAESRYPGIFATTPDQLKAQLALMGKHFTMIKPKDLLYVVLEKENLVDRHCLITFDDGLREQYEMALPILDSMGIQALFNVNGLCTEKKKVNTVHKIHWLRSVLPPEEFLEVLNERLLDEGIQAPVTIEQFKPVDGQNIYDPLEVRYIKYILNHVLPMSIQNLIVDGIYSRYNNNEQAHSENLYMSKDMIENLAEREMLGSHGYEHNPKTMLSATELIDDLQKNQNWIKSMTGKYTPFISYPYGGKNAVSLPVMDCAMKAGHIIGFTIERAINLSLLQPLLFARLDANDALGGKYPLMKMVNDRFQFSMPATMGRRWFVHE